MIKNSWLQREMPVLKTAPPSSCNCSFSSTKKGCCKAWAAVILFLGSLLSILSKRSLPCSSKDLKLSLFVSISHSQFFLMTSRTSLPSKTGFLKRLDKKRDTEYGRWHRGRRRRRHKCTSGRDLMILSWELQVPHILEFHIWCKDIWDCWGTQLDLSRQWQGWLCYSWPHLSWPWYSPASGLCAWFPAHEGRQLLRVGSPWWPWPAQHRETHTFANIHKEIEDIVPVWHKWSFMFQRRSRVGKCSCGWPQSIFWTLSWRIPE